MRHVKLAETCRNGKNFSPRVPCSDSCSCLLRSKFKKIIYTVGRFELAYFVKWVESKICQKQFFSLTSVHAAIKPNETKWRCFSTVLQVVQTSLLLSRPFVTNEKKQCHYTMTFITSGNGTSISGAAKKISATKLDTTSLGF